MIAIEKHISRNLKDEYMPLAIIERDHAVLSLP